LSLNLRLSLVAIVAVGANHTLRIAWKVRAGQVE